MSMEGVKTAEEKAAEKRRGPSRSRMGPPHMAMGMPAEKSLNFVPSAKRLFGLLRPHKGQLWILLALSLIHI